MIFGEGAVVCGSGEMGGKGGARKGGMGALDRAVEEMGGVWGG